MHKAPRTLVEKIWSAHAVDILDDGTSLLWVDRVLLHERTGGRMLKGVADRGLAVRRPDLVFGTMDHIIDTEPGRTDRTKYAGGAEFIGLFRETARAAAIPIYDIGDARQGIVHVMAPELGLVLPGTTVVCGDSHTCTLGGLGALAWGVGVTQGEHVLATQTLWQAQPRTMRVSIDGRLPRGVGAKDLMLALIARHSAAGGAGHAIEFAGDAVRALDVAGRLTLCNLAVEFGGWTGIVAPDATTLEYLAGRPFAPRGEALERALEAWRTLASDPDAAFDRELRFDCTDLAPQVTWGTSPEHAIAIDAAVPPVAKTLDASARMLAERALAYSGLAPGTRLADVPVDAAFIGSCTNARLDDLRAAAGILDGRRVAPGVRAICVPGSSATRRAAEAEGLDRIFTAAGFEWREAGCSLCFYAGGDSFGAARRVISTTNRNFENRQGPGVRTHLASPATVAASAIAGRIADPRPLMEGA